MTPPAGPETDSSPLESPAIGQELHLAAVLGVLKVAASGAGRTCLITGEAGVGKTRLVNEVLARARAQGCQVLFGKAQDYDHGIAYASLRDLLAPLPGEELDPEAVAHCDALMVALDGLAGCAGAEMGAAARPVNLLVTRLLEALCERRPTVVALDDANLSDDETLTALSLAARYLAAEPLLLVFTVRPDQWLPGSGFAATVGRLIESGLGDVVDIGPLDSGDTTALVASVLSARPDERLATYVYSRSRGNPLFARETLRALQEAGSLRTDHGVCYLLGRPEPRGLSRRSGLLHRLFRQDRAARDLARILAAFRRIHVDQVGLLQSVTGLDPAQIEAAFDSLTRAAIVTRVGEGWYEFTHPLLAEVLYVDLGPLERRRLHTLIAASIRREELQDLTDILEWTMHAAEAAAPGDRTAINAVLEAARLTANIAPLSSATWYRRAIDLLPPGAEERPDLMVHEAISLWKGSRPESAAAVGSLSLEHLPFGPKRDRILALVANAHYAMGHYREALALVQSHLSEVAEPAPFLAQQALLLAHTGNLEGAAQARDQAITSPGSGSTSDRAITDTFLGHLANCLGDFASVHQAVERLIDVGCREHPSQAGGTRLSALESAAYLLAKAGCIGEARAVLARVDALLPRYGWQDIGGQALYTKARVAQMAGEWDEALSAIRSGAVSLESAGLGNNLAWLRLLEVQILIDRAQLDEATELLQTPMLPPECVLFNALRSCLQADLARLTGAFATARQLLTEVHAEHAGGLVEPQRASLEGLVELSIADGRWAEAKEWAAELADVAARTGMPSIAMSADRAEAALGNADAARRLLRTGEREHLAFITAQAHLHLALTGDRPAVQLQQAAECFDALGAVPWSRRTAIAAKELGVALPRRHIRATHPASQTLSLTPTEVELVRLLRQGLTNRQISNVLHYSAKTIEVYLSRLYQKVGCRSRLDLVLAAERGELLGLPEAAE